MAHVLPTSPGQRRRNRLIAAALVAAVLVIAAGGLIIRTHRHQSSATVPTTGTNAATSTPTSTPPTSPSIATTTPAPTTPAPTTPAATPTTARDQSTPASTSPAAPAEARVDLIVDNNTARAGLASTARSRFEAGGWTVTKLDNVSGGVLSTCAFYDPSNSRNRAAAVALQAQFPEIKRVEPRFSRLPLAPIVVVVTSDYS